MVKLSEYIIEINNRANVQLAKSKVSKLAKKIGFSENEIEEINIVVSELAENLIEHNCIDGKIKYSEITEDKLHGIQIISEDKGPGINNINEALIDGKSEKNTFGIGLGAIKRLMSEFDISSSTGNPGFNNEYKSKKSIGTVILTRKWLKEEEFLKNLYTRCTRFGIMSRPKLDEKYIGDNFFLKYFDNKVLVSLIDGIGHGFEAMEVAKKAYIYLTDNFGRSLNELINGLDKCLARTRGAAVSIALIDEEKDLISYVGIGNITTRVFNSKIPVNPINYNGIVGVNLRKFKIFDYPWKRDNILVMTSDGVSNKYDLNSQKELMYKHPTIIADVILRDYGRTTDDATVIVGRYM